MKVKLLVSRGGPGISQNAGDVVEVSEAEGKRMIEANQAVPFPEVKRETASKKRVVEKAAK
jgi:hypothetical protein